MAKYQSFSALGTILESSLQKKRMDLDKAFKALNISMESDLLKEKIAQQSFENEIQMEQLAMQQKVHANQLENSRLNRELSLEKSKLDKWNQTNEKLNLLETEALKSATLSSDSFHSALGTKFSENEDWADNLNKALKKLEVDEIYRSRLINSAVSASGGNYVDTSMLLEELQQSVNQFNEEQAFLTPDMKKLLSFYTKMGVLVEEFDKSGVSTGKLVPSTRYSNIISSSLESANNMRSVSKERNELILEDDVDIQSKIDLKDYKRLENELKTLDLVETDNELERLKKQILRNQSEFDPDAGMNVGQVEVNKNLSDEYKEWDDNVDKLKEVRNSIELLQNRVLGNIQDPDLNQKIESLEKMENELIEVIETNKATIDLLTEDKRDQDAIRTLNLLGVESSDDNIEAVKMQQEEAERTFKLRSEGKSVYGRSLVPSPVN